MTIIINGSNTPTAGAVAVGDGTTLGFTAAGTAGQVLTSNGAGVPTWTDNGSGTVSSVSGTGTVSGLSLSGTVTTSGSLTLGGTLAVTPSNFSSQTANYILAAPNGSSGVPTFRAIVAADIPTLNQNTTGTASNVTGIVAINNGGTGVGSAGGVTAGGFYVPNSVSPPQFGTLPVTVGGTGVATLTGVLKGNGTSAFSAATAGTDYLAPPSGTAILKANSGGALANATAGTDYCAATSGSGILKGSSGNTTTATAGTDYVAPNGALGTPSSGTLSSCTVDGTNAVGYRKVPNAGNKSSSYTLATSDVGKYVRLETGASIIIPDGVFSDGDVISLVNNTGTGITITCSITTAYIAGNTTDKSTMTIANAGVATIIFISSTTCFVSGNVS